MDNIVDDIKAKLKDGGTSQAWLEHTLDEHPYFTAPLLLYLKEHGIEGNEELLGLLAIASPDRKVLATHLGDGVDNFAGFYPPEAKPETPDTDDAIDRFLNSFGSNNPRELEAINNAIFNPTPDYADILAAQDDDTPMQPLTQQDELINNFITESKQRERAVAQAPSQPHVEEQEKAEIAHEVIDEHEHIDDSMLQESLAKSYISRRKYAQALEIIENINLRFPEKSIYFADQIRFLRKLVLNETITNNK
ncbi:hypothetical protein [Sodaliphilus sp.]|uniref:hypothetical protein n=1 Tax=Sodaliphilus sp. TaxID=2815818 RepID=UPI00388FE141